MKKTDKKDRKYDKIESIHITDDMLLDRKMDEFLRQSMIEEADRLEEELNSDPELVGIGASDDLFLKIKARLQEMGAWEDDEEGETEGTGKEEDKEEKEESGERKPGTETLKEQGEREPGTETLKEREERESKTETLKERGEREPGTETLKEREERESGKETLKEREEREPGTETLKEREERESGKETSKKREERESRTETLREQEEGEGIYQFLSEEDREALEIGRKIRTRKKKKGRYWKRAAIAAIVLAGLFAMGMQGDANRNWILGALDNIIAIKGKKLQVNYQDDQENVRLNKKKEQEAWEEIKEELNVPVIEFFYEPDDMVFNKVYISKKTGEATMLYWYKETVVQVYLGSREKNSSASFISEESAFLQEEIVSNQKIEIKIWNTEVESVESYVVTFEYQDVLYFISGRLPLEEVEKMMSLVYLY